MTPPAHTDLSRAQYTEYEILWTTQLTQKAKTWNDGTLRVHYFNRRALVYDDTHTLVTSQFLSPRAVDTIQPGTEIRFDKHLVSVEAALRLVTRDLSNFFTGHCQNPNNGLDTAVIETSESVEPMAKKALTAAEMMSRNIRLSSTRMTISTPSSKPTLGLKRRRYDQLMRGSKGGQVVSPSDPNQTKGPQSLISSPKAIHTSAVAQALASRPPAKNQPVKPVVPSCEPTRLDLFAHSHQIGQYLMKKCPSLSTNKTTKPHISAPKVIPSIQPQQPDLDLPNKPSLTVTNLTSPDPIPAPIQLLPTTSQLLNDDFDYSEFLVTQAPTETLDTFDNKYSDLDEDINDVYISSPEASSELEADEPTVEAAPALELEDLDSFKPREIASGAIEGPWTVESIDLFYDWTPCQNK
ncbi:hypothetical protein NADFUDRAFT_53788 [Nadsonia fulvescens var. elongata DSM 6958]|uniref:5'-3' DNA helicase ZGRF1-like N-terminal domain-containing protein n=1 Tax=Nadsonia fulvescens var. elongata DSM 6958 TaxID=857566 RepID=A0A1E3PCI1_9ASCO|nr:hypothetical protein NADFUDRAFT_53788 [Nadsonia fulvescens var. elongata DSM 6958]